MQIVIRDESLSGSVTNELTLDVLTETITVRELIRSRLYQEVDEHNRRLRQANAAASPFHGLVTPTAEQAAHGVNRVMPNREIDFKQQFETACDAFERNGFFILIDDRQAESLDELITLRTKTVVNFVKLTPLVGG